MWQNARATNSSQCRHQNVAFEFGLVSATLSVTYVNRPDYGASPYHTSRWHRSWNSPPSLSRASTCEISWQGRRNATQGVSQRIAQLPPLRHPIRAISEKTKTAANEPDCTDHWRTSLQAIWLWNRGQLVSMGAPSPRKDPTSVFMPCGPCTSTPNTDRGKSSQTQRRVAEISQLQVRSRE